MRDSIKILNLHKVYRVGSLSIHAMRGVSLHVKQGEFLAITGSSGSGKSTLLNLMAGLERPSAGTIEIDGINITSLSENQLVKFRRERVGFVFQSFNLVPSMTALENVALPLVFRGESRAMRITKAKRMIMQIGLSTHIDHTPMQLSGGQQQRISIARALVVNPKIVFADEPTGNLDSQSGDTIMKMLKKIVVNRKLTLIVVTHDPAIAKQADRIVKIKDGGIDSIIENRGLM